MGLLIELLLRFGIFCAMHRIERGYTRLEIIKETSQHVILEVSANTLVFDNAVNASSLQYFWITNAAAAS
jgi:fumarate reductase subunit D